MSWRGGGGERGLWKVGRADKVRGRGRAEVERRKELFIRGGEPGGGMREMEGGEGGGEA